MIAVIYARKSTDHSLAKKAEGRAVLVTGLLALLLLSGCTTHGRIGALPVLPSAGAAAEIVVIREWRFTGSAHTVSISLDGVSIYGIDGNEHVIMAGAPRPYLVGAAMGWSESTSLVEALAQQRYYFRVATAPLQNGARLQPVDAEVGQALMAKTRAVR